VPTVEERSLAKVALREAIRDHKTFLRRAMKGRQAEWVLM
jgi:hypothetical protein